MDKDFLKDRKTGIGGSDIGAILGENEHKLAYEVYLDKVEENEVEISNEAIVWGKLLEDPIAVRYQELTGRQIFVTGLFRHKEYPFLIAHPDRIIPQEKMGLEIKTAGYHSRALWGEDRTQQIPLHYYLQIAHYMFVLDYDRWDIAVLIGGQELRIYTFERSKEADDIILEASKDFWENHVLKKIPPSFDYGNPRALEILKKKYNAVSDTVVTFDDNLLHWKEVWVESKELAKRYEKQAEMAQAHLLDVMKEANEGRFSDGSSFIRKLIKTKEYQVQAKEYVKFEFKKGGV